MKILHILWSDNLGGVAKMVSDLAMTQVQENCVGILLGKKAEEFEDYQDVSLKDRIKHYIIQLKSGFDISPLKCIKIYRIFREYNILHFHSFNPLFVFCAVISRKKIVYTVHGRLGFRQNKSFFHHIKLCFLKIFLNYHVSFMSFNSNFTKKLSEKKYGLSEVKKSVIYNGIVYISGNTSTQNGIEKSLWDKLQGKFIIGTVSRFVIFKCIDRLVHAFDEFQINKKAVLLLVGDGAYRADLERLIYDLKLSDKTIFTGFRNDVRGIQKLMDICVFPFKNEGFGLVAVEALSLGKPAIVFSDGGGIAEIVGGFSKMDVVENVPQLIDRLEYYYSNRNYLQKSAQKRKLYAKKFDIDQTSKKFIKFYNEILS